MFNRPTLSAPGPVRITPSELVTATALRVARAGYDAARVPAEVDARTQHRVRLAVAVKSAAPYVAAEALSLWTNYFGRTCVRFEQLAEEEAQQHGESAVYHSRNGFTMGLELAHALLGQHSHGLRGGARW